MEEKHCPFVSIVLAVRNAEALVAKCLGNLVQSDYPAERYEIIVVDDSSTDGTAQAIQEYLGSLKGHRNIPTISFYRMNKHVGYYSCINHGIRNSRGDIIVLYAHDLLSEKEWLHAMVDAFDSQAEIGGVYGRVVSNFERLLPPLYFAPVGMYPLAYKRWVFDAVGFFDERFKSRGDSDFLYRVKNSGIKMGRCDEPPVFHPLRRLQLRTLIDYAKRRQYDALLYMKEKKRSKEERVLGGKLTGPAIGSISPLGMGAIGLACAGLVILLFYPEYLIQLVSLLLVGYALTLALVAGILHIIFPSTKIKFIDRLRYVFWTPLFLSAILLGRMWGSLRWRVFVL